MSSEVEGTEETPVADEPVRVWRPSRKPDHRVGQPRIESQNYIVERPPRGGFLRSVRKYLGRPTVKIVVAVSLFIAGAVLFDATLNGPSWTERTPKQRATIHKGAPRPPSPSQ